jgi:hypothetical protein
MANWLQTVNDSFKTQVGAIKNAPSRTFGQNITDTLVGGITGKPLQTVTGVYGLVGGLFGQPSRAIPKQQFELPINDIVNKIEMPSGGIFSPTIPRSAMIPPEFNVGLDSYVQDFVNNIQIPTDSGLQMPQEEQAPQAQAPQLAPPPVAPKITPTKMPMPSDLDYIMGQLDPSGMSAYQSRAMPTYQNPMTSNRGYFDMNKAGTVGGKYIEGAGWMTDAAKAFGLKPEDLEFQAMMNQRIAGMYA